MFAGRNNRAGAGLWIVGDDHGTAQRKSPRDDPRVVGDQRSGGQGETCGSCLRAAYLAQATAALQSRRPWRGCANVTRERPWLSVQRPTDPSVRFDAADDSTESGDVSVGLGRYHVERLRIDRQGPCY